MELSLMPISNLRHDYNKNVGCSFDTLCGVISEDRVCLLKIRDLIRKCCDNFKIFHIVQEKNLILLRLNRKFSHKIWDYKNTICPFF